MAQKRGGRMIKLDVKPYCQDCKEFEHECQTCINEYGEPDEFLIQCKYASKCENICNYLKSQKRNQLQVFQNL